ncbi:MAG: LuxR C-terminal-related transcriptional regulator [Chloroflexota bacterium]|nr:LuxR C-terminal-related transcriptional regulator [Chloroflexota bacterium]
MYRRIDAARAMLLPPRPARLVGRAELLRDVVNALRTTTTGVCTITGMAGSGKSALASEAVHVLADDERVFPDGIVAFTATGYQGSAGLVALLWKIVAVFSPSLLLPSFPACEAPGSGETSLADSINLTRIALAGKRVLLLLDDLDARFPLRTALDALLASDPRPAPGCTTSPARVVLVTSRYIHTPALVTHRFQVGPLELEAALELFTSPGHRLHGGERAYVEQICAALGYLPLAIEVATAAVSVAGVPLALLAEHVATHPLDGLLDGEGEIRSALARALADSDPELQKRFALLSTLGVSSFGLESVAALSGTISARPARPELGSGSVADTAVPAISGPETAMGIADNQPIVAPDELASAAADLGQFLRHSLLELAPQHSIIISSMPHVSSAYDTRYQLHPLLYAHALDRLEQLEPDVVQRARRNVLAYALAYVERCQYDISLLAREQDFLLAVVTEAWQRKDYQHVVYLLDSLAYLSPSLENTRESERLLRWGIHASRAIQDQLHQALFLKMLGSLLCSRGEFEQARQALEECQAIAEILHGPIYLWEALAMLAYIAFMRGERQAALRFADMYLYHSQEAADPVRMASALFIRGWCERLEGARQQAYDDLHSSLRLLSDISFPDHDGFYLHIQAELARSAGDYAHARAYTETAVASVPLYHGTYNIVDMLITQAHFAYEQGVLDDASALAQRVVELAGRAGATHLHSQGLTLLRRLPLHPLASSLTNVSMSVITPITDVQTDDPVEGSPEASHDIFESLSQRELEVLTCVAAGLSNREIAARLVISIGTVKKHLEHIYGKLGVYTRTRAVVRARALHLLR